MEVIHLRYNTKYVMVMAASYAAIVGRNSDEVVLCRVIAENIRKEEKRFCEKPSHYWLLGTQVTTPRLLMTED
jgi:hypothetical protein